MDYNVPGGKLNRGLSVVDSVAILKGRELTESEYCRNTSRQPSSAGLLNGWVSLAILLLIVQSHGLL
jgi:hypothetical protein